MSTGSEKKKKDAPLPGVVKRRTAPGKNEEKMDISRYVARRRQTKEATSISLSISTPNTSRLYAHSSTYLWVRGDGDRRKKRDGDAGNKMIQQ